MGNFKLNMNGANRTIWTIYFTPKIDPIATCDLATQESIHASVLGKTWQVAGSCKFLQDGRLSRI